MKKIYFLSVLLLFLTTACTSLKESFTDEGRYYNQAKEYFYNSEYKLTIESCLRALRYDPYYFEAKRLINRTYPLLLDEIDEAEKSINNSDKKFKNEELYYLFRDMHKLIKGISAIDSNRYDNDFKEKSVIYREKAALDYYNAGVDDSYDISLSRNNLCFEYFKKASEIWGEEYLDSYTVAASVLYKKAELYIEVGSRESLLEAINLLKGIESWVNGYRDSRILIDELLKIATSYYLVIGDEILLESLENGLNRELRDYKANLISQAKNSNIARSSFIKEQDILSSAKELGIDTVLNIKLGDIEYTPPQNEAKFIIHTKRFWIDKDDKPLKEVKAEDVDKWHESFFYRLDLKSKGVEGYKDFSYSYIENSSYSKVKCNILIEVYSVSMERVIGTLKEPSEYLDQVNWISSSLGNESIFPEVSVMDGKGRELLSYDLLINKIRENADLRNLINSSVKLIIEDNPMDKVKKKRG